MSGRFNLNDYVTVDERIDRFWEQYPNGAIRTEIIFVNNDGSSVAIRASVYKDWEHAAANPDASGIAQELQGGANANKASWWENCETSAIGRALANLGMSISKQRPSREEMQKAQRYDEQDTSTRPGTALLDIIRDDQADPKERRRALHNYFAGASSSADLNQRADAVASSGMPKADRDAGYRFHLARLSTETIMEPASIAG